MKKLLFLFAFILFACSGSDEDASYPTITIVNATIDDNKKIRSISLAGYEFTGLNIEQGQSATYKLMDGISSSPSPLTVCNSNRIVLASNRNTVIKRVILNTKSNRTNT